MSTIAEKLQESKDGLDALLEYANGVTGAEDTTVGDAVKTLADGYGQMAASTGIFVTRLDEQGNAAEVTVSMQNNWGNVYYLFGGNNGIFQTPTKIIFPTNFSIESATGLFIYNSRLTEIVNLPIIKSMSTDCFRGCANYKMSEPLKNGVQSIAGRCFLGCTHLCDLLANSFIVPATVTNIGGSILAATDVNKIYFRGTPLTIDGTALNQTNVTEIFVPWSEGEVANAPWGATKATIHYNYIPEEE